MSRGECRHLGGGQNETCTSADLTVPSLVGLNRGQWDLRVSVAHPLPDQTVSAEPDTPREGRTPPTHRSESQDKCDDPPPVPASVRLRDWAQSRGSGDTSGEVVACLSPGSRDPNH